MKKSKGITLLIAPILSTILLNACDSSSESTTRDVYLNRDECVKDWGDQELCEEMNDEDSNEYKRTGGTFVGRPFWGPQYYPSDRSVLYKGKTITPTGKSTTMKPFIVTSRTSSTSRGGASSPSSTSSYGGFGSKSSSSSSSSSSS